VECLGRRGRFREWVQELWFFDDRLSRFDGRGGKYIAEGETIERRSWRGSTETHRSQGGSALARRRDRVSDFHLKRFVSSHATNQSSPTSDVDSINDVHHFMQSPSSVLTLSSFFDTAIDPSCTNHKTGPLGLVPLLPPKVGTVIIKCPG